MLLRLAAASVMPAFILLSLLPLCGAMPSVYVQPTAARSAAGEMLDINVSIANVTDLFGFEFSLSFDPGILRLYPEDVRLGPFLRKDGVPVFSVFEYSANRTELSMGILKGYAASRMAGNPAYGTSGSGALAKLRFQAIAEGSTPISLYGITAYDSSAMPIAISSRNGMAVIRTSRCRILSAQWDRLDSAENQTVRILIKSAGCGGENISIVILERYAERDGFDSAMSALMGLPSGNDRLAAFNPHSTALLNDTAVEWKAEFMPDDNPPPEYYFYAYMDSNQSVYAQSSNELIVKEPIMDRWCIIGDRNNVNFSHADRLNISLNASSDINREINATVPIEIKMDGKGMIRFFHDCTGTKLFLNSMSIMKQAGTEKRGYIAVRGINAANKTLYIDKIGSSGYVCILDIEAAGIYNMTAACNGPDEVRLACPGSAEGYSCSIEDGQYKVSGLSHSVVMEGTYCGDGSCIGGETCSSCSQDCGSCPRTPDDGGGGGGGGGGGDHTQPPASYSLNITLLPDAINLRRGQQKSYGITVTNTGTSNLTGVRMSYNTSCRLCTASFSPSSASITAGGTASFTLLISSGGAQDYGTFGMTVSAAYAQAAPYGRNLKIMVGECDTGKKRCFSGATSQICNQSMMWELLDTCSYGCDDATGSCLPPPASCIQGSTHCNGNVVESCENGRWMAAENCSGICLDGKCTNTEEQFEWKLYAIIALICLFLIPVIAFMAWPKSGPGPYG